MTAELVFKSELKNLHTYRSPLINIVHSSSVYKEITTRKAAIRCTIKKTILKNFVIFTGKCLCWSIFYIKLQTLTQVFSCGYCEIFKNSYLVRLKFGPVEISCLFYQLRFCLNRIYRKIQKS